MSDTTELRKENGVKLSKVISATMRFEITLPHDLPKESGDRYALERFRKLCEKLNAIRGVAVEYTVI